MNSAAGDTQVLDADSPSPDCKADDGAGDGAGNEIPIMCGETQTLQSPDSLDGDRDVGTLDLWGKTQLVDAWEETAAVDSGDEETQRTEVLSQGEEGSPDDDGGPTCGPRDEGATGGVDNGVSRDGPYSVERKKDDWVDPDASTDDEGGQSSTRSERVQISVTTTENNVFKDMDAGSNSRSLERNLETRHADAGLQCTYLVGADTQMAAEAMEALVHIHPANSTKEGIHPADGILIENSSKSPTMKRVSSSNILLEKRISTTNSEGMKRRSKRRKASFTKSRKLSPNSPRDLLNKSRSLENRTVEVRVKKGKCKLEGQLEADADNAHRKRRRTNQVTSTERNLNANLNEPSPSLARPTEQLYKQVGKKKKFIRSGSEILDNTKQKKRSIMTQMVQQAAGVPSNTIMVAVTSVVKSRAHKIRTEEIAPSELDAEDAAEIGKLEGSFSGEFQTSAAPSKRNSVSPIFVAQDPPRLSRSLSSRELLRPEAIEAPSTPVLKDVRRRKDMASIHVLLSRHLDKSTIKQQKKILTRLGLPLVSSISDATHFVTDEFVRTQNMLEALAVGKPVVTPMWLESCGQASCFIDEKNYILRDYKKEKEIGFNMSISLSRACQRPLLQGKRVFVTHNVKPNRKLIMSLVKASCGQEIERIGTTAMNRDNMDDLLVISCEEDYPVCIPLLQKGADVFSPELLLNGIVIQKLEYERHRLFGITR